MTIEIANEEIREARDEICEDISNLISQKDLVENFNPNTPLPEEEFHRLCETPLRYTDVLGKSLENSINNITYIDRAMNNFRYKIINGWTLWVSTSAARYVCIDLHRPFRSKCIDKEFEYQNSIKYLDKCLENVAWCIEFLRTKSIIKKSKMTFSKTKMPFALIFYVFKNIKNPYKRRVKETLKDCESKMYKYKERIDKFEEKYKVEFEEQQKYLKEFIEELLKWTESVEIAPSSIKITKDNINEVFGR